MFGFIRSLQNLLEKFKSNKRVWFTTIFVISVLGIFLSIFFLTIMTDKISKEVYESQVSEYKQRYDGLVKLQERSLQKASVMILNDRDFLDSLQRNNFQAVNEKLEILNKSLLENGFEKTKVEFKSADTANLKNTAVSVIQTKNKIFGLEVFSDGVFYTYLVPVVIEDVVKGVLELRSSIDNILTSFSSLNQEFVFLLNKSMAVHIALELKNENYESFNDSFLIDTRVFNSILTKELGGLNLENYRLFLDQGYFITNSYYAAHIDVEDTNGIGLGMIVIAEDKYNKSGFINIIDRMKSQVILVALGLIVSVLLFMF